MNDEFLLLFNEFVDVNELKWIENEDIDGSILHKNSLIEGVIKNPIIESKNSTNLEKVWKKLLDLNEINIDNINEVVKKYDLLARNIISNKNKKGYEIKEKQVLFLYDSNNIIIQLNYDNKKIYIKSCFIKSGNIDMFPLFYSLKFNSYNLFFLDRNCSIEYYDNDLLEKIEGIVSKNQSIKDSIIEYANNDKKYISYHLIRDYYNNKTSYSNSDLERYIRHLEEDITLILKDRKRIFDKIAEIDDEIKEIDKINKDILANIRKYNIFLEENEKLKMINDEKTKNTKTDKFIKINTDIFIDYSKNGDGKKIEDYLQSKINELYKQINNYPKELTTKKDNLIKSVDNDVLNSYLIGINYFLIMISIQLSNNTLESIYEGNLINKAVFDVKEIKELIDLINKNLLYQ